MSGKHRWDAYLGYEAYTRFIALFFLLGGTCFIGAFSIADDWSLFLEIMTIFVMIFTFFVAVYSKNPLIRGISVLLMNFSTGIITAIGSDLLNTTAVLAGFTFAYAILGVIALGGILWPTILQRHKVAGMVFLIGAAFLWENSIYHNGTGDNNHPDANEKFAFWGVTLLTLATMARSWDISLIKTKTLNNAIDASEPFIQWFKEQLHRLTTRRD